MAKANRKTRRSLEATKKKYMEATDAETRDFPMPDGTTAPGVAVVCFDAFDQEWCFPHPLFAPDAWREEVDAAESDTDKAVAIIGADQYEKFTAAGGSGSDVMIMWMDVTTSMQDEIRDASGKSSGPTRS